jgi:DNA-binding MarR family transcriptional regulator
MSSRLRRKGLIIRTIDPADRRATNLEITRAGEAVVRAVTVRRQAVIERIAHRIPDSQRSAMVESMRAFTEAAGDGPEQDWTPGWTS